MATETGSIFRKVALDRLSSPEQLDALMRVITPQAWLAFAPLAILIAAAIAWGWFGSVTTKVIGKQQRDEEAHGGGADHCTGRGGRRHGEARPADRPHRPAGPR